MKGERLKFTPAQELVILRNRMSQIAYVLGLRNWQDLEKALGGKAIGRKGGRHAG